MNIYFEVNIRRVFKRIILIYKVCILYTLYILLNTYFKVEIRSVFKCIYLISF